MSNAELRLKNKEVGIHIKDETRITTNLSWLLPAYRRQVSRLLILKNLGTLYLVLSTIVSHVKKLSLKICNQSTSKRDPAALFVFGFLPKTGTAGKIHEILLYLRQLVKSSNRRNSLISLRFEEVRQKSQ